MSPHCRFSDLGPFRLRIFSAQVGTRTRAHGDESNPLEISVSSVMKGEPGLATGLTTLGALMDEGSEGDKTSREGGLPTLPGLYHSTIQPSRRGFFRVHTFV